MGNRKSIDMGLSGYAELFMYDGSQAEAKFPRIHEIRLELIDDFPDHPFKVKLDEDMDQLVQSIMDRGIITPIILRPKDDGRYEIVAGHRRRKACEIAGLPTVRAEIRDLARDEAIILMVESNLQRSTILPSEKAFSYKMRLEAMKRQAGRRQKNYSPVGNNYGASTSSAEMANEVGESKNQIFRYIRLTYLVPALLDLVDEGKIALRPAVELSYLKEPEQLDLVETIAYEDATPSLAQAIKLRDLSKSGQLNADIILSIMCEQKPNQVEKISFRADRLKQYLPTHITHKETEEYILKALEYYLRHTQQ